MLIAEAFRAAHNYLAAGGPRAWPRAPPPFTSPSPLDSTPVQGDLCAAGVWKWLWGDPDFTLLFSTALFGADMRMHTTPLATRPPNRVPVEFRAEVDSQLAAEVAKGWLYPLPPQLKPLAAMLPVAPLQVAVEPTKVRRITDYSNRSPRSGRRRGVNGQVSVCDLEPAVMHRSDDLARAVYGIPGALLLVRDMSKAFRRVAVRWRDVPWLLSSWSGTLLADLRLPFGHAASAHLVCKLTQAIARQLTRRFQPLARALVYVDDFVIVAHPSVSLAVQSVFETMMHDLGLPISAPKAAKTGGWSTRAEWIGFIHDADTKTHSMPDGKREALLGEVRKAKRGIVPNGVSSLVGRLNHVASVFPAARAFLWGVRHWDRSGAATTPPRAALADLEWWLRAIPRLPAVAGMKRAPCADDPVIATDASLWGIGGELVSHRGSRSPKGWRNTVPYSGAVRQRVRADLWPWAAPADMMTVEAAAALVAVRRWAPQFAHGRVWLQLDNEALVWALTKGSSRHAAANALIRELLLVCTSYDLQVFPYHVASECNAGPDLLSRWGQTLARPVGWEVDVLPPCHWADMARRGQELSPATSL